MFPSVGAFSKSCILRNYVDTFLLCSVVLRNEYPLSLPLIPLAGAGECHHLHLHTRGQPGELCKPWDICREKCFEWFNKFIIIIINIMLHIRDMLL